MKVTLTVIAGPGKGRLVEFSEPRGFVIGRAEDADYRLPEDDLYVGRRHAYLEVCPPNCRVRDLGSTNPLLVNEKPVEEVDLKPGDILELGFTRFEVSVGGEALPLPEVQCLRCGRIIDVQPNEAAPDLCGPCASAHRSAVAAAPPAPRGLAACIHCKADLSEQADHDGRAKELNEIAVYSCEKCLSFEDKVRGKSIGEYALLRHLGEGGMGVVYLAHHSPTGRLVAVKQIKGLKDEMSRKRFERESRIAQSLVHKHVVRCLHTGAHANGPFIVTEYVPGGNLEDLLEKAGGKLQPKRAVSLMIQLLDAVEFLHQRQIVHRDIKPPNMLLREQDRLELTDFGLAKRYNEAGGYTSLNQCMGTLMYTPPEQVKNAKDVREPADIYSIGVTLYYLLTGKYTFDFPTAKEIDEVMKQDPGKWKSPEEALKWIMRINRIKHPFSIILTDDPTPIRTRDSSIPKRLAEVVDKAVRKDMGERYQSAAAFRTALTEVI